MATITKLTIYNDALQRMGQRRLATETDNLEVRHKLDTEWTFGAVNFCLDEVKPHWATKVVQLSGATTSAQHDLDSVHTLPDDYIALAALFSDSKLDQPVYRYLIEGRTIACEYDPVFLRYISDDHETDFTSWTPNFASTVAAYLASKLARSIVPQKAKALNTEFIELVDNARELEGVKEPERRAKRSTKTISTDELRIYNDALQILGLPHMVNVNDDHPARSSLDVAYNNDLVEDLLEEINWDFARKTVQISYDPSLEPDYGYTRVFELPDDLVRIRGVFHDEYMREGMRDYIIENNRLFTEIDEIYLDYIESGYIASAGEWRASFRKLVASRLAKDAAPTLTEYGADKQNAFETYEERLHRAKSIDANQSPPVVIGAGQWVKARRNIFRRNNTYLGRP